ncbi:MAG TPA: hypothetical protein VNP72_04970 [Longimicrobium sp.]|nr:hypothetical protein [Longimicrobium sp.]
MLAAALGAACTREEAPAAAAPLAASAPANAAADTSGGRLRAVSADGQWVVEVRPTPGILVETAYGEAEATELWLMRADGGAARMLLRGRAGDAPERTLSTFQHPALSPDGREVYFLSNEAWVTSAAVHAVDVETGRERYVCPGNSLHVVPRGPYAGHLVVSQHRYWEGGGSYDWPWLVTPQGRALRPILRDEATDAQLDSALAALEAGRG